ncbi:NAD(P)/FAD-dependent oxidoreductase [Homoserinibacter sp. YIM 151385]|uniref:NAD(P)/FAD-dependent oxidoreductase n=1 Tax=Homoserinibacter sp. YIM 151385 TaxID=2985506 RepID=UPI0022EFEA46|nr:NAD(P)/FAD-dependent oxidoreductase [Homoserinibacter sp. YIM 151385]WBU38708.1 NAD(P)/FAD-dependent oxidoreductase [Homoserinibacter sp. YIM 151385]
MENLFDVIVIGGGSAGLSAALGLGRARRRVLVLDGGSPRNGVAAHMHNVLGHDGRPPAELLESGRAELARYGIEVRRAEVDAVEPIPAEEPRFAVLAAGTRLEARRLVVATGIRDRLPETPGLAEAWGRGVVVCPYCDGWEVRDQPIAVLASSPQSAHQIQMLRQWSADLVYLLDGQPEPDAELARALAARGVRVERERIAQVDGDDWSDDAPAISAHLADGRVLELARIFTMPASEPRDAILRGLGAEPGEDFGPAFVRVDATGRTSVPGVWAAGNVINPGASVAIAIGQGAMAGGMVNADLIAEDTRAALAATEAG